MANIAQAVRQLEYERKRTRFAWAKYYEVLNTELTTEHRAYETYNRIAGDEGIPEHIKAELKEMGELLHKKWECPVCLDMIEPGQLEITNCGHYYCRECLRRWSGIFYQRREPKWDCCVCKRKHGYREDVSGRAPDDVSE